MKLIYVYRKLGINDFVVNLYVVKNFIFIYIFFWRGRGVQGDKKKLTLSLHSLWEYSVYLITNRFVIKVASTR